jgi:hypothetical protein
VDVDDVNYGGYNVKNNMLPSFLHQSHSMFHLIKHKVSWCLYGIPITLGQAVPSGQRRYLGQRQSLEHQ